MESAFFIPVVVEVEQVDVIIARCKCSLQRFFLVPDKTAFCLCMQLWLNVSVVQTVLSIVMNEASYIMLALILLQSTLCCKYCEAALIHSSCIVAFLIFSQKASAPCFSIVVH